MAVKRWTGNAAAVVQVDTLTPANVNIGNTFTATMNGKNITFTATAATVANVTAGLQALLSASAFPEFREVTWTSSATAITGTGAATGKPFTVTSSAAGGTATLTRAAVTAATGPNDINNAANYDTGTLPTNADDLYFENGSVPALYNLTALSAVTLTSLNFAASYTGTIGLPRYTALTGGYAEYRPQYFAIGATTISVGQGPGQASGRIKINTGSALTTINISNTAQSIESGVESFLWIGTHASNVLNVSKGIVGVAVFPGEVATLDKTRSGFVANAQSDSQIRFGSGVTLTTSIDMLGGIVNSSSNVPTVSQQDGQFTLLGTATATTFNCDGGSLNSQSSGTITNLNISDGGTFTKGDMRPQTITTTKMYAGSKFTDRPDAMTLTNGIALQRCGIEDVDIIKGVNKTLSFS